MSGIAQSIVSVKKHLPTPTAIQTPWTVRFPETMGPSLHVSILLTCIPQFGPVILGKWDDTTRPTISEDFYRLYTNPYLSQSWWGEVVSKGPVYKESTERWNFLLGQSCSESCFANVQPAPNARFRTELYPDHSCLPKADMSEKLFDGSIIVTTSFVHRSVGFAYSSSAVRPGSTCVCSKIGRSVELAHWWSLSLSHKMVTSACKKLVHFVQWWQCDACAIWSNIQSTNRQSSLCCGSFSWPTHIPGLPKVERKSFRSACS